MSSGEGIDSGDGLAAERTTLAWRRTSMTIVVAALAIIRLAWVDAAAVAVGLAAIAVAVAAAVLLMGTRRRERLPLVLAVSVAILCVAELVAIAS